MKLSLLFSGVALLALLTSPLVAEQSAPAHQPPTTPDWVRRSNDDAQVLLKVLARFNPEFAGRSGVSGVDDQIIDLKPGFQRRSREATREALAELERMKAQEKDPTVLQDLDILIKAAKLQIRDSELDEKYEVPYIDLGRVVYLGIQPLLDEQVAPERRPAALGRLRKYAGMEPGTTPVTKLAEAATRERLNTPGLMGPFKGQLEKDFGNQQAYVEGVGKLFEKFKVAEYQEPFERLKQQLAEYHAFLERELLPKARTDFRLPAETYAFRLEQVGIDLPPDQLAAQAHAAFNEIQTEMMALAPAIARDKGLPFTDYRDIIRELKKDQWQGESILPNYQKRLGEIDEIIRRERLVTLPQRAMEIQLASEAETAAIPAPHMRPPRLIGNTGEHGIFMLPLRTAGPAGAKAGSILQYDDFTFNAAAWTLSAHEARPGHELQFDGMVENGVSIARALFSFNSVNVEGWGLYSEAILKPYMPRDGQLISLQHRLVRAARAFLDPELQAGKITPEQAKRILMEDVCVSEAMANQEVERYTFWAPGQAPSYFYGYTQLMRLRADTEKSMGRQFDQKRFHDFVLAQGIIPPPLLRQAVFAHFVSQGQVAEAR